METSYIVILQTKTKSAAFAEYLKKMPRWGRLTDDSWLIATTKSASQIRDELMALKDPGDRIAVIKSGYVAAWVNLRANNDWLKKNL